MGLTYTIKNQQGQYFITCTVHQWVDVFTRKEYVEPVGFSAVAGGVGAEMAGGDFWRGAATGATVASLNHLANHQIGDDPKRKGGKGNTFRGGKQSQREE